VVGQSGGWWISLRMAIGSVDGRVEGLGFRVLG